MKRKPAWNAKGSGIKAERDSELAVKHTGERGGKPNAERRLKTEGNSETNADMENAWNLRGAHIL